MGLFNDLRPPEVMKLFNEFQETAENQVLSLLDDLEAKIDDLELSVGQISAESLMFKYLTRV